MKFSLGRTFGILGCAALAAAAGRAAHATPPFQLPPIGDPSNMQHHPGKVIWADLATPDLQAAKKFYAGLFGWTYKDIRAGETDYAVAMVDGTPIAGLIQKPVPAGEHHPGAWLTFIAVRDVDGASRIALKHGAKSVSEAKSYAGRGRQAVLADPQGAVFALLASSSGDPPDYLAAPGEWIWSSLIASDPKQEADFYKSVFGYDVYDMPSDDGAEHVILSSDEYARAGIHSLPPEHRYSHWVDFIRVADAAASAAKAAELGGRVLVEPYVDRHGGKIAVIADPNGTPVGLMEWSETESKAEPK